MWQARSCPSAGAGISPQGQKDVGLWAHGPGKGWGSFLGREGATLLHLLARWKMGPLLSHFLAGRTQQGASPL